MARLATWLVCALLAASMVSGGMIVSAQDAFSLSFGDPLEYPENPDADLKSLASHLEGDFVIVEISVYGNISADPRYFYSFSNAYLYDDATSFSFYYSGGNGTFDWYNNEGSGQLTSNWQVEGGTLAVSVPGQYAGSPDMFNLSASSSYMPEDGFEECVFDSINQIEYDYQIYDFDNAEPLGVPASVSGNLDDGDSKVYSMDLPAGCGVLITLNGSLGDMPALTIYDSEEEYVAGTVSMNRDVSMTFVPPESGIYYLAIDSWSLSGGYDLETSFRGESGEAYQSSTPGAVPWSAGDEWSMGGYVSVEDLFDQMMEEAGVAGAMYSLMFPEMDMEGGIADFLVVTYAGEEGGQQRFDFRCRLYADITVNMTAVTGSESYIDDEMTSESTSTMYLNTSGTLDIDYTGSVWLGYYEAPDGTGYWGVEREAIDLSGSADVYMGMHDSTTYSDMEPFSYHSDTWMSAALILTLSMENEPGIPFLPAGGDALSVDKRSSTTYEGSMDADIWYVSEYSDMEEYPDIEPYDMNDTLDQEFGSSYTGYYALNYGPDTGAAQATPLMTDPFTFLMLSLSSSVGYSGEEAVYPFWLDYAPSEAAYDPDSGFFTSFELPLNPLSGTAMSLGGETGGDGQLESIGMLGLLSGLAMDDVSDRDADAFFEDPAAYLEQQEGGGSSAAMLALVMFAMVAAVVAFVLLSTHRRQPGPPAQPPEAAERQAPAEQQQGPQGPGA